jgi:hypothetical protein
MAMSGSWVCQEIPKSAVATDIASVNPLRAPVRPATGTDMGHEVLTMEVTLARRAERPRCAFKELSSGLMT